MGKRERNRKIRQILSRHILKDPFEQEMNDSYYRTTNKDAVETSLNKEVIIDAAGTTFQDLNKIESKNEEIVSKCEVANSQACNEASVVQRQDIDYNLNLDTINQNEFAVDQDSYEILESQSAAECKEIARRSLHEKSSWAIISEDNRNIHNENAVLIEKSEKETECCTENNESLQQKVSQLVEYFESSEFILNQRPNNITEDGVRFSNPMRNSEEFRNEINKKDLDQINKLNHKNNGKKENKNIQISFQEKDLNIGTDSYFPGSLHINKYPGSLQFILDSITSYSTSDDIKLLSSSPNNKQPESFQASILSQTDKVSSLNMLGSIIIGVSFRIEVSSKSINSDSSNFKVFQTQVYPETKNIKISHYLKIPVESNFPLEMKIILQQHRRNSLLGTKVTKKGEFIFKIQSVEQFQNRLVELTGQLAPYRSSSALKNLQSFFFSPETPSGNLKAFCSYISNDEIPTINSPQPASLFTLSRWLLIRKHAHSLMFAGYVTLKSFSYSGRQSNKIEIQPDKPTILPVKNRSNRIIELHSDQISSLSNETVKSDHMSFLSDKRLHSDQISSNIEIPSHSLNKESEKQAFLNISFSDPMPKEHVIWARRYIKWYGYTIYILDDNMEEIDSINISDAQPSKLTQGIILFKMPNSEIEIHCDTIEKIRECSAALSVLFPKLVSWL